jgi:hypothetical protein
LRGARRWLDRHDEPTIAVFTPAPTPVTHWSGIGRHSPVAGADGWGVRGVDGNRRVTGADGPPQSPQRMNGRAKGEMVAALLFPRGAGSLGQLRRSVGPFRALLASRVDESRNRGGTGTVVSDGGSS